jgi:hypothetical protein
MEEINAHHCNVFEHDDRRHSRRCGDDARAKSSCGSGKRDRCDRATIFPAVFSSKGRVRRMGSSLPPRMDVGVRTVASALLVRPLLAGAYVVLISSLPIIRVGGD